MSRAPGDRDDTAACSSAKVSVSGHPSVGKPRVLWADLGPESGLFRFLVDNHGGCATKAVFGEVGLFVPEGDALERGLDAVAIEVRVGCGAELGIFQRAFCVEGIDEIVFIIHLKTQ